MVKHVKKKKDWAVFLTSTTCIRIRTEQYDALLDKAQIDLVSLAVNLLFTRTFAYSMASTNVSKRFKEFSTWISYCKWLNTCSFVPKT